MQAEWPVPQARSAVVSRGLELSLCEWGDVSSAGLVLVGAHGFLDCAEFFAPLVMALHERCADLAFVAMSFAGHGPMPGALAIWAFWVFADSGYGG